jgi:catechol 2,3-dioxygenase-like lactoylglutathione lyase family enzyme
MGFNSGGINMTSYANPGEQLVVALYVQDLAASLGFFTDLGFVLSRNEGTFAELQWDQALLFVVQVEDAPFDPSQRSGDLRILVPDVDRYWGLVKQKGLRVIRPIENRGYGLRDFILAGPGGLAIRFATRLSDIVNHKKTAQRTS